MNTQNQFIKTSLSVAIVTAIGIGISQPLDAAETQSTISSRAKTTTVVGTVDELKQQTSKQNGQVTSQLKTNQYRSIPGANLKAEIELDLNQSKAKTRAQMRSKVNDLPVSSKVAQKNGMDHLYIHDAAVYLYDDTDGDGYYSKLRVDFDVDSPYDDWFDVYAEMFIREIGTNDWIHYYTTDVFEIHWDDSSDEYSVSTRLNTGFPPGKYEVLIDLFEYGYSGLVDTLDAYDDPDLDNLPLEDITYEVVGGEQSVTLIQTVKTEIFTDNDNDGYYHDFKITFDADTSSGQTRDVFAKLYQRSGSSWQFESETGVFTLSGASTTDTIAIEGDWQSGYATAYYDFRIELIDANTNEILDDVSNEFDSLLQVPLEDAAKDQQSSTNNPPPASTTSSGSGGGSWGLFGLALLALFGLKRRR
ncbi:MAG: hypothetical protein HWD86_03590 [Kangiellaceae bacterium]|nr:hypothetical protein [Kangiellaceae bacterium]